MKINFKISRIANFYFFLSNLSAWSLNEHRKDYVEFWLPQINALSQEEQKILSELKIMHQKYNFGPNYLGKLFFDESKSLDNILQELPKQDGEIINKAFLVFRDKFDKLFTTEEPLLSEWRDLLEVYFSKLDLINIFSLLSHLYQSNSGSVSDVEVFVLFSAPNRTGGGANIGQHKITLEISRYNKEKVNHVAGIVFHELIHLFFEKSEFFPLLLENYPADMKMVNLIKELTVGALFPKGVLGVKFLNNSLAQRLLPEVDQYKTQKVFELINSYLIIPKKLDQEYLLKLREIIN
jgi:hypothetical protein